MDKPIEEIMNDIYEAEQLLDRACSVIIDGAINNLPSDRIKIIGENMLQQFDIMNDQLTIMIGLASCHPEINSDLMEEIDNRKIDRRKRVYNAIFPMLTPA